MRNKTTERVERNMKDDYYQGYIVETGQGDQDG